MGDTDYIGISENRMRHIVAVANKCYELAKKEKLSEEECRAAFMCGYLHDVGYAFSNTADEHPKVSLELVQAYMKHTPEVIAEHGNPSKPQDKFLKILNTADLTVNSRGEDVSVEERLTDILRRHTEHSKWYRMPCLLAEKLDLVEQI